MSKSDGGKIAIKFDRRLLRNNDISQNVDKFTITGYEYNMVPMGELEIVTYPVESVDWHPTEDNTVLITITRTGRFNNVVGDISVKYAGSAGNADTVDGQNFTYSNSSNSPAYL